MKLSRLFKTVFMTDFIGGLLIAIKELFKSKKIESVIDSKFSKGSTELYTILNLVPNAYPE